MGRRRIRVEHNKTPGSHVDKMDFGIAVFFVLLVGRLFVYNYLEISPLKYGILKAMASQSKELDQALEELLKNRPDLKVLNKDYRTFEKRYLANLNLFILQHKELDRYSLRRGILQNKRFQI
jgi:hypothetical protein